MSKSVIFIAVFLLYSCHYGMQTTVFDLRKKLVKERRKLTTVQKKQHTKGKTKKRGETVRTVKKVGSSVANKKTTGKQSKKSSVTAKKSSTQSVLVKKTSTQNRVSEKLKKKPLPRVGNQKQEAGGDFLEPNNAIFNKDS